MKKLFVFVVDSFLTCSEFERMMKPHGLTLERDFSVTGAGGAEMILHPICKKWLHAENLLVFMSSFHGETEPAVELSKRIKEANPNARIIFRSNTERSSDPVFERNMTKRGKDHDLFLEIISSFVAQHGGTPTPVKQP